MLISSTSNIMVHISCSCSDNYNQLVEKVTFFFLFFFSFALCGTQIKNIFNKRRCMKNAHVTRWQKKKHFWGLMLTAKMNYHLHCIKSSTTCNTLSLTVCARARAFAQQQSMAIISICAKKKYRIYFMIFHTNRWLSTNCKI